jgi:hypothetical protein
MDMTTVMLHTRQEGARRNLTLCQHTFPIYADEPQSIVGESKSSMDAMPMHYVGEHGH